MTASAKASARKSLCEYKPVIVFPNGSTEICQKSPERQDRHTKHGIVKGNRMARGTTYATREEAIAAAQNVINIRREDAEKTYNEWINSDSIMIREKGAPRKLAEARLWQSKL